MPARSDFGTDRSEATAEEGAQVDVFSDVLRHLAMQGTLYFSTAFSPPWGVEVPAYAHVARFHYVVKGRCMLRVKGSDRAIALQEGDLAIIPHGAGHLLYGDPETEAHVLPLDRVVELSGFTGKGTLVYGGARAERETELVCGHFAFDPLGWHPMLAMLPACLHVPGYGQGSGPWLVETLRMIGTEADHPGPGTDLIGLRMSEILLAQVLRSFVQTGGADVPGLAGMADPRILRALEAIHAAPDAPWTVDALARRAGMSRTRFATRFRALMPVTPLVYVARWRLQVARSALKSSGVAIAEIAERAGYQSPAAFARRFRKEFGITPAAYRRGA